MRVMLVIAIPAILILLLVGGRMWPPSAVAIQAQAYSKLSNGVPSFVLQISNAWTSAITMKDPELLVVRSGDRTVKMQLHLGKRVFGAGQTYTIPIPRKAGDQQCKLTVGYTRLGWKRNCQDFLLRHHIQTRLLQRYLKESTTSDWLTYEQRS
jgi:hypothetical protein